MKNLNTRQHFALGLAGALLLGSTALAGVSQEEANKLGNQLTPMGSEAAGNADGSIPAWDGGIKKPPFPHTSGDFYKNPYSGDQPLYTITSGNAGQYASVLSEGHQALLKKFGTYKMIVYPTRRSCAYPDFVYAAAKKNAVTGGLESGGAGVKGAVMAWPFPIPKQGVEIIWNHNLRYRGFKLKRQFAAIAPTAGGDFTPIEVQDNVLFQYSDPQYSDTSQLKNISLKYSQRTMSPPRRAGNVILVHETINQLAGPRKAWVYSPGTRRVRRAPNIEYDNPQSYSDGLQTSDNFDVYNGSPDRYEWTIKGKQEMIIAYNTYEFQSPSHSYKDLAKPNHINQDILRYEKHRVWNVEGKLRADARHIYAKRTFFVDEDGWNIAAANLYDGQGKLWRVQEAHLLNFYDMPLCANNSEIVYDLQAGRYVLQGVKNQLKQLDFSAKMSNGDFTPQAIRKLGR